MILEQLLKAIKVDDLVGSDQIEIAGLNIDSRKIEKGHLFIAVRGTQTDGHQFIGKAIENGAAAVVCEDIPEEKPQQVTFIKVESTESCAGKLAHAFYGEPSKKLKLVGVTGTNGKTTIATLLYNMFRKMGHKCGLLSTVCNYIDGREIAAKLIFKKLIISNIF